jgi:hypothetical protein
MSRNSQGAKITQFASRHAVKRQVAMDSQNISSLLTLYNPVVTVRTARFSFQKVYVQPTLCLYGLHGSESKQRLFPYTASTGRALGEFTKL